MEYNRKRSNIVLSRRAILEEERETARTATLASIGTAGVPSAGIIMLIIVLQSVGMGSQVEAGIALILGVDRILMACDAEGVFETASGLIGEIPSTLIP